MPSRAELKKKAAEEAYGKRIEAQKKEREDRQKWAKAEAERKRAYAKTLWPITRRLQALQLKKAVIVDVWNMEQAKLAAESGAMAINAMPPDAGNGVMRMANPRELKRYLNAVLIPVITKVRVGLLPEAQIMERLGVDFINENPMSDSMGDNMFMGGGEPAPDYMDKNKIGVPTMCGVGCLTDCLKRIQEGALILRTNGNMESGNFRAAHGIALGIKKEIRALQRSPDELKENYLNQGIPEVLVDEVIRLGRVPVLFFGFGGITVPADVALMMKAGCDGLFIDNKVFNSNDPGTHIEVLIEAMAKYRDTERMLKLSEMISERLDDDGMGMFGGVRGGGGVFNRGGGGGQFLSMTPAQQGLC